MVPMPVPDIKAPDKPYGVPITAYPSAPLAKHERT